MSAYIARLGAVLGINTTEFKKGIDEADGKSKKFRAELRQQKQDLKDLETTAKTAAALISAAFVGLGAATLRYADEVSDLADANEITIARVLELRDALTRMGGDADSTGKLLASFTNSIDGAATGSEKLRKAFSDVGVSLNDIATKSSTQLMDKALAGLSKIEDPVRRNAIAFDLFGKAAKGVDWRNMASAAQEIKGNFEDNAKTIEAAARTYQSLALFADDAKLAMARVIQPFTNFVDKIPTKDRVETLATWFKYLGTVMLMAFGVKAVLGVVKLSNALVALGKKNPWVLALTAAGAAVGYIAPEIFGEQDEKDADYPARPKAAPEENSVHREITQTDKEKKSRKDIEDAKARIELMKHMMRIDEIRGQNQVFSLGVSKHEMQLAESALKQEEESLAIANAKEAALRKEGATAEELALIKTEFALKETKSANDRAYRDELILANRYREIELYNEETSHIEQRNKLDIQGLDLASKLFAMNSWDVAKAQEKEALERKLLDIEQQRDKAKKEHSKWSPEIFAINARLDAQIEAEKKASGIRQSSIDADQARAQSWSAGWEDAMRKFVEDSKLYGKAGADAFNSIVGNMNSAIDNFVKTGKFSFKDFSRSIIQDLIAIEIKMQTMALLRMAFGSFGIVLPGKAEGGPVASGSPYIVGERGPELFVPNGSGTIIPNNQLAMAGGGPQVVYNGPYIASMNAIDTQSATQFLAKNKAAVWAANQSAQRSVPVSR